VESHGVHSGNIPAVKRQVLSALSAGSYDWLHAAAHGSGRDPADQTISVWLENGEALTPDDLVGPQIERHIRARRPAFVLNACTVARSAWELTGMSGWANQLIKVGAGLFLAPLWSVTDDVAQVFVQTFYNELANNACVADAMREARMTARAMKGDPTWMAYVLFAHPNARVALGTMSSAPL
jgi:CHAT domain-containing protein